LRFIALADLFKVGMSKERRADPQITVGLLVARDEFPLDIHASKETWPRPRR